MTTTEDTVREPAPANNLPPHEECALRVANSDFIQKRVREGGYGADSDSKLASQLHRFIYEYDDADPYMSAWFLHRLELLLEATKADALHTALAAQVQQGEAVAPATTLALAHELWAMAQGARPISDACEAMARRIEMGRPAPALPLSDEQEREAFEVGAQAAFSTDLLRRSDVIATLVHMADNISPATSLPQQKMLRMAVGSAIDRFKTLPAASAQTSATGNQFWLIERGANHGQFPTVWWANKQDGLDTYTWVESVHEAAQFASAKAAQEMADKFYLNYYAITSHSLLPAFCPKCGSEEWGSVNAERGRARDVPFNRCSRCETEWSAS